MYFSRGFSLPTYLASSTDKDWGSTNYFYVYTLSVNLSGFFYSHNHHWTTTYLYAVWAIFKASLKALALASALSPKIGELRESEWPLR